MNTTQLQSNPEHLFHQGHYEEAIAFYEKCIEIEPEIASNYWYLGLAHLLCHAAEMADAIWMSILVQGSPEQIDLWIAELVDVLEVEALKHLSPEGHEIAKTLYEKIVEIHPTFPNGYLGLGIVHLQQKDFVEAIARFQQVIELDSELALAHYYMGLSFQGQGDLDTAIEQITLAIDLDPNSADAFSGLGSCFRDKGENEEAIERFKKAVELNPDLAAARYNLALCYKDEGDLDKAIKQLREAIRIDPNFAKAYSLLGACGYNKQAFDEAIPLLEKAIILDPNLTESYLSLGACFSEKYKLFGLDADAETAISYFRQVLEIDPNYTKVYYNLGDCLKSQSRFSEAIEEFNRAISLDPDLSLAYWSKALCFRYQGEIKTAIDVIHQFLQVHPDREDFRHFIDELLECDRAGYLPTLHEGKLAWDAMLYKSDRQYYLFYLTGDSVVVPFWSTGDLAAAVSSDLNNWEYLGTVLPTKPNSSWENGRMLAGSMYQEDGIYYFFYSAASANQLMHEHIGLATSKDGRLWERGAHPLVEPDPQFYCAAPSVFRGEEVQHRAWRDPYILKDEMRKYYMFISACCPGKNPYFQGCVGLAVADKIDGPYNVLPPAVYPVDEETEEGIYYELERPQVIYRNGKYHLFFSMVPTQINPKWIERVGKEGITDSSLHWYVSDAISGPYQPGAEKPVVKGSDRTCLYGTNLIESLDGQMYAYGTRYRTRTLELNPRFPVRWVNDVPEIVVDEEEKL